MQSLKFLCAFCVITVLFSVRSYCQNSIDQISSVSTTQRTNIDALRDQLYQKMPENLKQPTKLGGFSRWRKMYNYANSMAINHAYSVRSGNINQHWPELENYLNAILRKIIPESETGDTTLHVFVSNDWTVNASINAIGYITFNIGLLDQLNSEAGIAAVLAHEYAHYKLEHTKKKIIKEEKWKYNEIFLRKYKQMSEYSINNELESDSMAVIYLTNADYSLKGFVDMAGALQRSETYYLMHEEDEWSVKETTHPNSSRRRDVLIRMANARFDKTDKSFLVDRQLFYRLKQEAKVQLLDYCLANMRYHECIEFAFKYHLMAPEDPTFINYVLEGLRLAIRVDPKLKDERFITHLYYENLDGNVNDGKEVSVRTIFDELPIHILRMGPMDVAQIQANFYWQGEVKFITNQQAFEFYTKVGELLEAHETNFSAGLYYLSEGETQLAESFLDKYLAWGEGKHHNLIQDLRTGKLKFSTSNKKLLVLSDLFVRIVNGTDEGFMVRNGTEEEAIVRKEFLNTLVADDKIDLYEVDDIALRANLYKLETLSSRINLSKKTVLGAYEFFPEMYADCKEMLGNMERIDFLTINLTENNNLIKDFEENRMYLNTTYSDFFANTKKSRYVSAYITSLRFNANQSLFYKFISEEEKMDFNNPDIQNLSEITQKFVRVKDIYEADNRILVWNWLFGGYSYVKSRYN